MAHNVTMQDFINFLKSNASFPIHCRVRKIMTHLLIVEDRQLLTGKMNTDKKGEG